MSSKIGIVCDHGGFELKEELKKEFSDLDWVDYGVPNEDSVDYPDMAGLLANGLLNNEIERGIAVCGTGIGISIALNRYKTVRAALCHDIHTTEMGRKHNDANILAMGGRILEKGLAFDMVRAFLNTPFEGGRHERRVNKIDTNHSGS